MIVTARQIRQVLQQQYAAGEAAALSRIVCCEILGQAVVDYYVGKDITLSSKQAQELDVIMDRLLKFEPIQYIQGYAPFLGRRFAVEPGVLIPRPETAELVEMMLGEVAPDARILDVGTGSGCIAVSLSCGLPEAAVTAWDISDVALRVAAANSEALGARVKVVRQDVFATDAGREVGMYDVIVSNPPYIAEHEKAEMEPNVVEWEPALALYVPDADPLRYYRRIAELGRDLLCNDGRLYFEINRAYGLELKSMLEAEGYMNIRVLRDISGNDRFIIARK